MYSGLNYSTFIQRSPLQLKHLDPNVPGKNKNTLINSFNVMMMIGTFKYHNGGKYRTEYSKT